jgi:hypothetical protein
MFEELTPDPGREALVRVIRIFDVLCGFNLLAAVIAFFIYADRPPVLVATFLISVIGAWLAYLTARGLEHARPSAKWLAIVMALISILNVPVGTVIGVITLVYLNRARKAGLLAVPTAPDPVESEPASSPAMRGALVGSSIGLCAFFALLLAVGRPDSYIVKLLVIVGIPAAIGGFVGRRA